jgi:hypothetical protein
MSFPDAGFAIIPTVAMTYLNAALKRGVGVF